MCVVYLVGSLAAAQPLQGSPAGMNKLTTYFGQAVGKQTLAEAIKAGGWKVLIDGTLA